MNPAHAAAVKNTRSVVAQTKPIKTKSLLSIVELGGYPNLTALYKQCGYSVSVVNTTRKALSHIKKASAKQNPPDVIVAEFIFSPTYSSQLSNFEGLLAGVQRDAPDVKIIALYHKKDKPHLDKVAERFPVFASFSYPVNVSQIRACLEGG